MDGDQNDTMPQVTTVTEQGGTKEPANGNDPSEEAMQQFHGSVQQQWDDDNKE